MAKRRSKPPAASGGLPAAETAAGRAFPPIDHGKALKAAADTAADHHAVCHPERGSTSTSAADRAMATPTPPKPQPGRWGEWSPRWSSIDVTAMTNTTALVKP